MIPIVFAMGADPVQLGLVASLNRPAGNITGVTVLATDQMQKRLQLLHDAVPAAKVFGLIINPDNLPRASSGARTSLELAEDTVRTWDGTLQVVHARTEENFDAAFASLAEKRIEALATGGDALFTSGRGRLVRLGMRYAMPMILQSPESTRGWRADELRCQPI